MIILFLLTNGLRATVQGSYNMLLRDRARATRRGERRCGEGVPRLPIRLLTALLLAGLVSVLYQASSWPSPPQLISSLASLARVGPGLAMEGRSATAKTSVVDWGEQPGAVPDSALLPLPGMDGV